VKEDEDTYIALVESIRLMAQIHFFDWWLFEAQSSIKGKRRVRAMRNRNYATILRTSQSLWRRQLD